MALRIKTIEYAFPLATATVATTVARDFTQIAALDIPETTSRTFRSVILEVSFLDTATTTTSLTAVLIGIGLGAVGRNDATVTKTIANSGEQNSYLFSRDVTSYFQTNYTGTSMTADCRVTVTGPGNNNATAKLIITYEYDDSATTLAKTVRIPVDGNTGTITTTLTNIGGVANQWPLLDTFLPEMGITYKDIFFQIDNHEGTTAAQATNPQLNLRFDGSTTIADAAHEDALNSDRSYRRIDKLLGLVTTTATHNIEVSVTQTAASFNNACISGVIIVTYTYTPFAALTLNEDLDISETDVDVVSAAGLTAPFTIMIDNEEMRVTSIASNTLTVTRAVNGSSAATHTNGATIYPVVINSLILGVASEEGWSGGTATGDKSRFSRDIWIQEPGRINLVQSGVLLSFNDAGAVTLDIRAGSQASRTFAHAASAHCGFMTAMRRIDSGGAGGVAGVTLARGKNTFTLDWFTTSATAGNIGSNLSGIAFLNYTSGVHPSGEGVHQHTTAWNIRDYSTGDLIQKLQVAADTTFNIPETDYFITGLTYQIMIQTITGAAAYALAVLTEVQSGEGDGAGWAAIYSSIYSSDAEVGYSIMWGLARTQFKRWPNDPGRGDGNVLDIETARNYRFDSNITAAISWQMYGLLTYHSITYSISGTIAGSSGGTVNIKAYRTDTGEKIGSTSRSGNGSYSITWYDNTIDTFAEAWESSALLGRSDDDVAV